MYKIGLLSVRWASKKVEVRDRETTLDEGNHSVFPLVGTMSQHLVTQNIDKGLRCQRHV